MHPNDDKLRAIAQSQETRERLQAEFAAKVKETLSELWRQRARLISLYGMRMEDRICFLLSSDLYNLFRYGEGRGQFDAATAHAITLSIPQDGTARQCMYIHGCEVIEVTHPDVVRAVLQVGKFD